MKNATEIPQKCTKKSPKFKKKEKKKQKKKGALYSLLTSK